MPFSQEPVKISQRATFCYFYLMRILINISVKSVVSLFNVSLNNENVKRMSCIAFTFTRHRQILVQAYTARDQHSSEGNVNKYPHRENEH